MKILVTGGAGYIGSHTTLALLNAGHDVTVIDNLSNSSLTAIERVEELASRKVQTIVGDVRDVATLTDVLHGHIDAVIHFAALKAVGESVEQPLMYYDNNVGGSIALMQAMHAANVNHLVFSSSATVYGDPDVSPIPETAPYRPANPYGQTKRMVEEIMLDFSNANQNFNAIALRYFNPVGAHESARIGEDPQGIPNNLMPYIQQVAVGRRDALRIWGNDYDTIDGTGVRDYIHVMDLADAHVKAVEYAENRGFLAINIGTGRGSSVLEVLRSFEKAVGHPLAHEFHPRRDGDVAEYFGDPSLAKELLGWEAQYDMDRMCADAWRWQQQNPNGYE